ncbi:hypothetical protein [Kangiella aquimarina]|uniref:Peptidase M16 C-terminal domain-containing protein n=1 Tax=Kangiella aquimarina TaxID=261965 RepID=A0ABZ0X7G6_9GAMM|nr:hypothetical protein [Kangiella aquimarina]WQG86283.1 hypothetical protein SR900_05195 [Kangiella aquimarina]
MRKLLLITFLTLCFSSKAADFYTSIKSSLLEGISDGFHIQLIDANISSHYVLLQASGSDELKETFLTLKNELSRSGLKVTYTNSIVRQSLILKLPKELLDSHLEKLLQRLSSNKLSSVELIVFGGINQQRLLGVINRQFNASNFNITTDNEVLASRNLIALPASSEEPLEAQQNDWLIGLTVGLFNCSYIDNGYINFYYFQQQFWCKDYSPNHSLTDKDVADLKDKLYSDIQLSLDTPEGFLNYIGSFKSERRLELSQLFFNRLPSISIDNILEYHYKKILNVPPTSDSLGSDIEFASVYQLPGSYKVKSQLVSNNSKVVKFDLAIDSSFTCVQLNCASLAGLPYIKYSASDKVHLFSMRYPSAHETTVINELNKVLFIPLSTSNRIAQENLLVSLQGGFLLEAYDDSFKLMSKLPLVNAHMNTYAGIPSQNTTLAFTINNDNKSRISVFLNSVPGGQHWEESELMYFILLSWSKGASNRFQVHKSNTLVNTELSENVYLEADNSPLFIDIDNTDTEQTEQMIQEALNFLGDFPEKLSRNDFVDFKKSIITNLSLLEADNKALLQVSHLFDLEKPSGLLIQRLENLSYEQFKAFLAQKAAFNKIIISTNFELNESTKQSITDLSNDL